MNDHVATNSEALAEFADNAGIDNPDQEWLLSSWDTWEHNPHYRGEPGPHPESDDYPEELGMTVEEWVRITVRDLQEYAILHKEEGDKRMTDEEFAKDFVRYMDEGQDPF